MAVVPAADAVRYHRRVHGRPTAAFDWAVGGAVIAAVAFAWLVYFRWKDHHPEPVRHIAGALLLGVVAAGLALVLYAAVEALGGPVAPGPTAASAWGFSLLVVGPVEEGAKWAVLVAVVTRWKAFDEEIDGLVYAATIALGFACVESLLYLPRLPWEGRVARALSTPLSHAVFSSAFGFGVGHARFVATSRAARWGWPIATLAVAALAHGVYDALILAHDATLPAAVIVFALWAVLVLRARQIVARLELAAARRHH